MNEEKDTCNQTMEYAMDEYKILWDYYKVSLEERRNLFEWYFKVVALPASVIGFLLTQDNLSKVKFYSDNLVAMILVAIFLCGLTLYITYVSESVNATKYFRSITRIRKFFCESNVKLYDVFKVDSEGDHKNNIYGLDLIKITKGLTIPIINSAIAIISVSLIISIERMPVMLVLYVITILIHLMLYFAIYKFSKME